MDLATIIQFVTAAISAASLFVAMTPTPNPDSTLGRLYKVIEMIALVVNRAKDTGNK